MESTIPSEQPFTSQPQKTKNILHIGLFILIFLLALANIYFLAKLFEKPSNGISVANNLNQQSQSRSKNDLSSPKLLFSVQDIHSHEYSLYSSNVDSSNLRLVTIPGIDIEARKKTYEENFDKYVSQSDKFDELFDYPKPPRAIVSPDKKSVAISYAGKLALFSSDTLQNSKVIFEINESTAGSNFAKWNFDQIVWSGDSQKMAIVITNEPTTGTTLISRLF